VSGTVGSACVGSNPAPATTVISQDIEDTLNPRWSGCFFLSGTAGFVSGGLVVPAGVEG